MRAQARAPVATVRRVRCVTHTRERQCQYGLSPPPTESETLHAIELFLRDS